jgi:N-carbamoyl-L-amino-acid hydrolase
VIGPEKARIDPDRMRSLLDGINAFGRCVRTGGYNRPGFSDADLAARQWLARRMEAEGLAVARDQAANVFGWLGKRDSPVVMAGSHLDTVPNGGAFDGALGVAVALECALAIRDAGIELRNPIEVVATSEEEGRFGGMLGSQAIVGAVTPEWLDQASDSEGNRLQDVMVARGFDPGRIRECKRSAGSVKAFLELHIEQGPVLERAGVSIGIADSVSGVAHWTVSLTGTANHSGTTPMDMRADAFAGLAGIAAAIPAMIRQSGTDQSRITIGKVELAPNFPHTIPGQARFSTIIRDTDETVMRDLCDVFRQTVEGICAKHGLRHTILERSWLSPAGLDPELARLVREEAERARLKHITMPSGAGHDAQTMQACCPSTLIFVPSRHGISHSPEEWTDWTDIRNGAALMLSALIRLACGTDAR